MSEVDVTRIRQLTAEERREAWDIAAEHVIGSPPKREHFNYQRRDKLPGWVRNIVYAGITIAIFAVFVISAYKINRVGYESFIVSFVCYNMENCDIDAEAGRGAKMAAASVGIALVLMAEVAQLTFSVGLSTLEERNRVGRGVLWSLVLLATIIALGGNLELSQPWGKGAWAWIFAVSPPIVVIGAGWLLKEQMMNAVKARREEELAFADEYALWDQVRRKPEAAPNWKQVYGNVLKDALVEVNKSLGKAKLYAMPAKVWARLVYMEIRADREMEIMLNQYEQYDENQGMAQIEPGEMTVIQRVDIPDPLSKPSQQ